MFNSYVRKFQRISIELEISWWTQKTRRCKSLDVEDVEDGKCDVFSSWLWGEQMEPTWSLNGWTNYGCWQASKWENSEFQPMYEGNIGEAPTINRKLLKNCQSDLPWMGYACQETWFFFATKRGDLVARSMSGIRIWCGSSSVFVTNTRMGHEWTLTMVDGLFHGKSVVQIHRFGGILQFWETSISKHGLQWPPKNREWWGIYRTTADRKKTTCR